MFLLSNQLSEGHLNESSELISTVCESQCLSPSKHSLYIADQERPLSTVSLSTQVTLPHRSQGREWQQQAISANTPSATSNQSKTQWDTGKTTVQHHQLEPECVTSPFLPLVFTTPSFVSGEATSSAGNPGKEQKLLVLPQFLGLRRKSLLVMFSYWLPFLRQCLKTPKQSTGGPIWSQKGYSLSNQMSETHAIPCGAHKPHTE